MNVIKLSFPYCDWPPAAMQAEFEITMIWIFKDGGHKIEQLASDKFDILIE